MKKDYAFAALSFILLIMTVGGCLEISFPAEFKNFGFISVVVGWFLQSCYQRLFSIPKEFFSWGKIK